MATHSSVLAWRIPGTGEPGGLPSMGLQRVGHDWSDIAIAKNPYTVTLLVLLSLSCFWLFVTPWTAACQASLSFTISLSLLKLMSIELRMPSNHLISVASFSCRQSFSALGSFISSLHLVAKELELQLQHQYFQWIFSVDFLPDWLVWSPCCLRNSEESSPVPQFESINSLALRHLYGPNLTSIHDYWKNHNFDYTDSVGKLVSLLSNTLPRFIIAFLPKSKCLLILWLQSLSAVILESKKMKCDTVSTFPRHICHEVMELDAMIFVFWMLSFKPTFSLSSFT